MNSKTLQQVVADLESREAQGLITYGCTVDRIDLTQTDWMLHAYHEALDLAMYLRRVMEVGNDVDGNCDDGNGGVGSADGAGDVPVGGKVGPRITVSLPISLLSASFYCSVYVALVLLTEKDGTIDANMRRLSGMLDMSKTTVQRALRYLREAGYVERVEGSATRNVRYRIIS